MTDAARIDRCRAALRAAGWSISEVPGGRGVAVALQAEKPRLDAQGREVDRETILLGHPRGMLATYEYVCRVARVGVTP